MNSNHELIKSIANRDRKAFHHLYQLFSDKVYSTALSYIQNEHDAEEIAQDVFTSIYRNAEKFKGDSAVSTWIYKNILDSWFSFPLSSN